jgi:hypothetical protein
MANNKLKRYCIVYLCKKPDSFCGAKVLHDEILRKNDVEIEMVGVAKRHLSEDVENFKFPEYEAKFEKIIFIDIVPSNILMNKAAVLSESIDLYINTILDASIYDKKLFLSYDINIFETDKPRINSVTKLIFKQVFDNSAEVPKIIDLIDKAVKSKDSAGYSLYTTLTVEMFDKEYSGELSGENELLEKSDLYNISSLLNSKLNETTKKIIKNCNIVKMHGLSVGTFNCQSDFNHLVTRELTTNNGNLSFGIACLYFIYSDLSVGVHYKLVDTNIVSEKEFEEFCKREGTKGYKYAASTTMSIVELADILSGKIGQ